MNDQTTEHSVVAVAGLNTPIGGDEQPWLFLRCETEDCGWWLGYQPEMTIETLAAEARHHIESEAALTDPLSRPTEETR